MSSLTLTPTRMQEGVWYAVITQEGEVKPHVKALHLGGEVADVELEPAGEKTWNLKVPVPASAITDGVQTIVVIDQADESLIGQFTLMAGEDLGEDILAEVELLRAELDMLKRAFRRHCVETA